jgi:hypothetical protein
MLYLGGTVFPETMWKVLGKETVIVDAGEVWARRLAELSQRRKDAQKFRELFERADLRYYFDSVREVHMFYVQFPEDVTMEQLDFLGKFIASLQKAAKAPVVELDGESQAAKVVLTSDQPVDVHKKRNNWWEAEEEKEERQAI